MPFPARPDPAAIRDERWERRMSADGVAPWIRPGRRGRFRLLFPAVFSFVSQLPIGLWMLRHHESGPLFLVAGIVSSLALLGARRWPGPTVVVVGLSSIAALSIPAIPPVAAIPFLFAIVGACVRGARVWAFSMVVVSIVLPVIGFVISTNVINALRSLGDIVLLLVATAIGENIRVQRARYAEYRASADERRQTEAERERVRIARELHDVLAHSLSSINVQAGVGLHLIATHPDKAADALASIKSTSKNALDDVRTVLGILRGDDEAPRQPEPDLDALPHLIEGVEELGLTVALFDHARPRPSRSVQLASFRIVQEALTNVTRHSGSPSATVVVRWDGDTHVVTVTDAGGGARASAAVGSPGGRRGILGMRERAELLGGTLSAGFRSDGGFEVVARIPDARAHAETVSSTEGSTP